MESRLFDFKQTFDWIDIRFSTSTLKRSKVSN